MKKFPIKPISSKFSLTFRISLGITLLITFLMGAVGISIYQRDRIAFVEDTVNRGWGTVHTAKTFALDPLRGQNYQLLNEMVKNLEQDSFILQAAVLNADGRIVAHREPQQIGQVAKSGLVTEVMQTKQEKSTLLKDHNKITAITFTAPIADRAGNIYGYLYLVEDFSFIQARLLQTAQNILLNFVLAALAGLLLTRLIILRAVHRPVQVLLSATERISVGDFSSQLPVTTKDELGSLAQGFNLMSRHLSVLFNSIKNTVDEMSQTSLLIAKRSEFTGGNDKEALDHRKQLELMKEINSSAKRLSRMSDKLNSLALQFKTTN